MSPTQFANGPALSGILTQEECFKVLMNISAPGILSVPPLFSTSTVSRTPTTGQRPKLRPKYKTQHPSDMDIQERQEQMMCNCAGTLKSTFVNEQVADYSLAFSVDKAVRIIGVILPTQFRSQNARFNQLDQNQDNLMDGVRRQIRQFGAIGGVDHSSHPLLLNKYGELIYAFLQDWEECRLTYTHFSARVSWEGTMEVLFNRPVSLLPNKTYKIVVALNKVGRYPIYNIFPSVIVEGITFSFEENPMRESIVKRLIFETSSTRTEPEIEQDIIWALADI